MKDAYRNIAGVYDRLFDNMNKGLALAGIRLSRPKEGMNILDVGCGTGTHLELYQRYGCHLYGIDLSPSMLEMARKRLGDLAQFELVDATCMPYENRKFDLVIAKLVLHEMQPQTRSAALSEMKRVLKEDGHILLIDFHPGPYVSLKGWISKAIIFLVEFAAGREHFKNYRQFMATNGLPTLLKLNNLEVKRQKILAGGAFGVYLVTARNM